MKKTYTKPNMEIVSFTPEDVITTGSGNLITTGAYQTADNINTINY